MIVTAWLQQVQEFVKEPQNFKLFRFSCFFFDYTLTLYTYSSRLAQFCQKSHRNTNLHYLKKLKYLSFKVTTICVLSFFLRISFAS